ncbi:MAG: Filamentation induced by cAMP protein Fic [Candidatus Moranbacteria bacterium GW2011_GWC2_37_73]|nr:MAG: Filamentation induced by cAMP protein Fic [Parcubacteria group bacterium GW2011_GWC1_36_108]KKQ00563.1 MAG: Filamentation induced by cAMP protein Fic [Candidatus Moranbacteria bacterium GW2011_GWD1_36_198]KKQ01837.1 MAG: Filamentation induced by cAMP protein Fic [Candidatus Moranbacteria bacterium GW2011_GWD2_36_198]KKQ40445.1 MAG: Filamentation induced by cAMP protein Fic [Candidatus Moranbacteria bacterium GW2011_GWC2_37_73]HAS00121.1 Fic family protein [Candidatus Moranbacteria bacte
MKKDRLDKRIRLSNEILLKITKIDEMKGQWKGSLALNPRILGQLKRSVIITSTGSSTRIEGSKMTDQQVDRFLRGIKQLVPKNRDEQEVAGYADLLGRIFDHHDSLKITENRILQLHEIMLEFSEKDKLHRGKYKKKENTVAIVQNGEVKKILFNPTPPWLVKKEMDDALEWLKENQGKKEMHPLVMIANFIFEFLAIHPFEDGNGRLSRALTNLMMLQAGYLHVPYVSLEEIIEDKQSEYYLALRETQKNHKTTDENIDPWINFFLDCILIQSKKAIDLLKGNDPESLLSEVQKKIFDLFGNVEVELGVAEIKKNLADIPLPTIKKSVARLLEHGLIRRIGMGRATRYRMVKK